MIESTSPFAFGAPIAAFAATWMVVAWLLRSFSDRILDHPNERSLHQRPVPRTGGIGVTAGIAVGAVLISPADWWPLWLGAAILVGISFLEDLAGLPIWRRLIAHFLAAGVLIAGLMVHGLEWGWAVVVIVPVVWMINLYNFMDGMDGLAGGMAVFGFGFLAVFSWIGGNQPLLLVTASIAAAAGAFLLFNFHPARIFLGDAGSTTLGFLAAGLGLIGWQSGTWSLGVPLLVFSPVIIDASVTLIRRMTRGEKFWRAHRSHYYQRLVLAGWGHQKTAWVEYGLMILCGLFALAFHSASGGFRVAIIGVWAVTLFIVGWAVVMVEEKAAGREALMRP